MLLEGCRLGTHGRCQHERMPSLIHNKWLEECLKPQGIISAQDAVARSLSGMEEPGWRRLAHLDLWGAKRLRLCVCVFSNGCLMVFLWISINFGWFLLGYGSFREIWHMRMQVQVVKEVL